MKPRPTGVVLAAIALGFVSLIMLFFAAMTVVSVLAMRQGFAPPATANGAALPPMTVIMGISAVIALLELAAAIWGGATVAGLLKLKPWARISIMVLGGCIAAFSLLGAIGMAAVPALIKATPNALPPNANPAQMHLVFLTMTVLCLMVAAVGIWWIVYFALKSTGEAFTAAPAIDANGNVLAPVERRARPAHTGPLTDFTFAQPIPPEDLPKPLAESIAEAETPQPPAES